MSYRSFKNLLITTTLFSAVVLTTDPALAQTNRYTAMNAEPSVEVNLDVLQDLGTPVQTAPVPLYQAPAPVQNNIIETTPVAPPAGFENRNLDPVVISSQTTTSQPQTIQLTPPATSMATIERMPPVTTAPVLRPPAMPPVAAPVTPPIGVPVTGNQVITRTTVETTAPRPSFLDVIEKSVDRLAGPSNTPPPPTSTFPSPISQLDAPTADFMAPIPSQQEMLTVRRPTAAPAQPVYSPSRNSVTLATPTAPINPEINPAPPQVAQMPPVVETPPMAAAVTPQPMIETPPAVQPISPPVQPLIAAPAPQPNLPVNTAPTMVPVKDMEIVEVTTASAPAPVKKTPNVALGSTIENKNTNNANDIQTSDIDWRKSVTVTPAQKAEPAQTQDIQTIEVTENNIETDIIETSSVDENTIPEITASDIDWREGVKVMPVAKNNNIPMDAPETEVAEISPVQTPDDAPELPTTPVKASAITPRTTSDVAFNNSGSDLPTGNSSEPIGRENDNKPLSLTRVQPAVPVASMQAVPQKPLQAKTPPATITNIETISLEDLNREEDVAVIQPAKTVKKSRVVKLTPEDMDGTKPLAEILADSRDNTQQKPLPSDIAVAQKISTTPVTTPASSPTVEPAEPIADNATETQVDAPIQMQERMSIAQFNSQPSMPVGRPTQKVETTPVLTASKNSKTVPVAVADDIAAPSTAPEKSAIAGYSNMTTEVAVVKSMSGPYNYNRNPKPSSNVENITVEDLEAVNNLSNVSPFDSSDLGTPPQIELSQVPTNRGPAPDFVSIKTAPEIAAPKLEIAKADKIKISKDAAPEVTSITTIEKTETVEHITAAPVTKVTAEPIENNLTDVQPASNNVDEPVETAFFMPALNDSSIVYEGASQDISDDIKAQTSPLIDQLKSDPDARLQLRSYAASTDGSESSARRISLARAIELRKHIMAQGIAAERLDVRALGQDKETTAPVNRIDMIIN